MRYNPDAQAAYEELERRGYFKDNPDALSAAKELARRGVLEVGLYPTRQRQQRPAPVSRVSPFLLETPEEATADISGRFSTTRLGDIGPYIAPAAPLDPDAVPRKVAVRVTAKERAKQPKKRPAKPFVLPQYTVSDEERRSEMVRRALPRAVVRDVQTGATAPTEPTTGSIFNPDDALRAYLATPDAKLRRFLRGTSFGELLGAPTANPDAAATARLYGLPPTDAALYGAAVREEEDKAAGELGAFGRAFGDNAAPGAAALMAGRFAARLLPGPWKLAGLPLAFLAAGGTLKAQEAVQRGVMGDIDYNAYQRQLAQERDRYPVSTFLAEQIPAIITQRAANPLTREGLIAGGINALGEAGQQAVQNLQSPAGQRPGFDIFRILGTYATGSVFSGADTGIGRKFFRPVDNAAANLAARPGVRDTLLSMAPDAYLRENFDFDPSRVAPEEFLAGGGTTYPGNLTPRSLRYTGDFLNRPIVDPRPETFGPPEASAPPVASAARSPYSGPTLNRVVSAPTTPYTRINIRNREALSTALQDPQGFGYDPETADATATIWEAIARSWAERNGKKPEDWYRRYVAGITNGGEEIARFLLEEKGADPSIAPEIAGATQGTRKWTSDPMDARQVVSALSSPNASTGVHELAHVFRKQLGDEAGGSAAVRGDLATLESWAGVKGGKWDSRAEEKFARAFERWLQSGKAPNESLSGVFGRFKEWLTDVYSNIVALVGGKPAIDRHPAFNPEVVSLLSRYVGDVSDITGTGGRRRGIIEQGATPDETIPITESAPTARQRSGADVLPERTPQTVAGRTVGGLQRGGEGAPGRGEDVPQPVRQAGDSVPETARSIEASPPELVDPDTVQVMPGMQFKRELVDAKNNVTDQLKNQRDYDVYEGGILTVWERQDGQRFAVDGHHRLELAKRANRFVVPGPDGNPTPSERQVMVRVLRESDGWTPESAKAWGVRRNLREGKAKAIDAADALLTLDSKENARAEVVRLPKSAVTRDTAGLLELSENARAMVRNGAVGESVAAGIGESLRGDTARQDRAMKSAAKSPAIRTYEDGLTLGGRVLDEELIARDTGQMGMFEDFADFEDTIAKQTEIIGAVKKRLGNEKSKLLATENTEERPGEVFDTEGRREEAGRVAEAKSKADALINYDPDVKAAIRSLAADVLKGKITQEQAVSSLRDVMLRQGKGSIAEITARGAQKPVETPEPASPEPSPYAMEGEPETTPDSSTFSMFDEPATTPKPKPATPPQLAEPGRSSVADIEARIAAEKRDLAAAKAAVKEGVPFSRSRVQEIEKRLKGLGMQLSAAKKAEPQVQTPESVATPEPSPTPSKSDLDFDLTRPIADVTADALKRAGIEKPTPEQTATVEKGIRWGRERIARAEAEWEQYKLLDYDQQSGNAVVQSAREDANGNKYAYSVNLKNGYSTDPDSINRLKEINDQLAAMGVKERVLSKHTQIARRLVERDRGEIPPAMDDVLFQQNPKQDEKKPVYVSALRRTAEEKLPNRTSAQQARAILDPVNGKGSQNAVKQEEWQWSGLSEFLDEAEAAGRRLTKEEILAHLDANRVDVRERVRGGSRPKVWRDAATGAEIEQIGDVFYLIDPEGGSQSYPSMVEATRAGFREFDEAKEFKAVNYHPTRYSEYSLPGGDNYREVQLRLPLDPNGFTSRQQAVESYTAKMRERYGNNWADRMTDAERTEYRQQLRERDGADHTESVFNSSHWDEPNVVVHLRMSDREGANGEKLLHIEEVQSDWHQEGRDKGYKGKIEGKEYDYWRQRADVLFGKPEMREEWQKAVANRDALRKPDAVPDAPFKGTDTWAMLGMKRAMRYAADNGYDGIVWTPGIEHVKRYEDSTRQVIDKIDYHPNGEGLWWMVPQKDGYDVNIPSSMGVNLRKMSQEDIEKTFGVEIAKKVVAGQGKEHSSPGFRTLEGDDLTVGGEGMKGFYDKILPAAVSKYVKKWGASVGQTDLKIPDSSYPAGYRTVKAWSIPVVEEMGEPHTLFQRNKRQDRETLDLFSDASAPATGNQPGIKSAKAPVRQRDLFVDQGVVSESPRRGQQTFDDTTHGGLFAATPAPDDGQDDGQGALFSRNRRQAQGQPSLPGSLPPTTTPGATVPRRPLPQGTPTQNQLPNLLPQQKRDLRQTAVEMAKKGGALALDALSVPKSLLSSVDISAPGRQGAPLGAAKPDAWVKAWVPMIRSFRGKGYEKAITDVARHPYAHLAADMGLYLSSRDDAAEIIEAANKKNVRVTGYIPPRTKQGRPGGKDTDNFPSQLAARLPWVRGSEQAYAAFLDTLRMDVYSKFVDELKAQGKDPAKKEDRKAFEDAARVTNILSGRGELGILDKPDAGKAAEAIKQILNLGIFSPRFVASRFQFMNPVTYARLDPSARKAMAKGALTYAAMWGSAMTLLAATTGAEVSLDIEDPNFGKLKYGDWTYDLGAGNLQMMRYLYRMGASTVRTVTGKSKGPNDNAVAITKNFVRSKASPTAGFLGDMLGGKTYPTGEKFDAVKRGTELLLPLGPAETYKATKQEGVAGFAKSLPSYVGVGVQNRTVDVDAAVKSFRDAMETQNARQGKPRRLTPTQESNLKRYRETLEKSKEREPVTR